MTQGVKSPARAGAESQPAGDHELQRALNMAARDFRAGRLAESKAVYNEILRRRPGNASAVHFLGLIAHQEGDHERAIKLLEKAVEMTRVVPTFHGNLGEVYRVLGMYAKAIACCRRALEIYPVYPEALNTLGAALYEQRDLAEAETKLRRAIESDEARKPRIATRTAV